jgi:hypothetical protein
MRVACSGGGSGGGGPSSSGDYRPLVKVSGDGFDDMLRWLFCELCCAANLEVETQRPALGPTANRHPPTSPTAKVCGVTSAADAEVAAGAGANFIGEQAG